MCLLIHNSNFLFFLSRDKRTAELIVPKFFWEKIVLVKVALVQVGCQSNVAVSERLFFLAWSLFEGAAPDSTVKEYSVLCVN